MVKIHLEVNRGSGVRLHDLLLDPFCPAGGNLGIGGGDVRLLIRLKCSDDLCVCVSDRCSAPSLLRRERHGVPCAAVLLQASLK